jgi:protein SCO1/2
MNTGTRTPTLILIASIAVLAAAGGFWLAYMLKSEGSAMVDQTLLRDGPLLALPEPKQLADFVLYDHNGDEFSETSLEGEWTLVFFGFSSCPHICPNTLFLLTAVVDQLEKELPAESLPQVLFVSVDPERDTPEVLQQYRERFGGGIEAVSGADDQLRALAMDLGSHYVVPEHEAGEWYNVDHSISVHLLDPQARWVALLSPPHDAATMAEVLERFLGGS